MSSSERLLSDRPYRCRLAEDCLVLQDQAIDLESQTTPSSYSCFPGSEKKPITQIPYKDILWCEYLEESKYKITYVVPHKKTVALHSMVSTIEDVPSMFNAKQSEDYSRQILEKAYGDSMIAPSILVIVNPHGGPGKARSIYNKEIRPILEAAHVNLTMVETQYSTHGTDIARDLDIDKYDIVACCSGDGIPHEVINGFYQRPDKGVSAFNKIAVTQLPGGSGNALALSTHGSNDAASATFSMLKSVRTKIDVMSVTQTDSTGTGEVTKLSFLSQCYGTIAEADIGTEHLRWMGPIRFDLGVAHKVFTRAKFPCDLYVKYATFTKDELYTHFQTNAGKSDEAQDITEKDMIITGPKLSEEPPSDWIQVSRDITDNLNIFYVGNMPVMSADTPFFPAALPNDGTMDMVLTDTRTPVLKSAAALLSVEKGTHVEEDGVLHHKIKAYRLVPRTPEGAKHYISIDGEDFPFKTFQVEVLPGVMTGLLNNGAYVSTNFGS